MTVTANIIAKAREVSYDTTKADRASDVNRVLTTLTNNSFSTATKKEVIESIWHIHETWRIELIPEEIALVEHYMDAVAVSTTPEELDSNILLFLETQEVNDSLGDDPFFPYRQAAEKYKDYISATLYMLVAQWGQEELITTLHVELRNIMSVLRSLQRIENKILNAAHNIGKAFGEGVNMFFDHFRKSA